MADPSNDMTSVPNDTERSRRVVLAEAIERRLQDIERRWLDRVKREVARSDHHVTATDLRDAIGAYLEGLAHALRGGESIEAGGTSAWAEVAREHALTRVRLGFDVEQLIREFILLRRVLFEVAREEQAIANDRHGERLADLIDAAIATSVKSYTESRDHAARRVQAEHIGFLTHELRNPLSTATMACARLRKKPELVAAAGDTLDMLDRSLNRLSGHIDALLLTQRLDANEVESRPTVTRLGPILADATRAAALEASQKGIELASRYDPDIELHIDSGLTTSALQNVVDNAVKFTDRGRVEVVTENLADRVLIHVYDNCDGLSDEELKTIFEPFKRAHSEKPGTGLGLAIARRALEAQGGEIGAESRADRGCHFWLTLPKPQH
jgi:signal transduction histidine kinase